jgi:hypothetical protein
VTHWPCLFRRSFPRCFGSARLSLSRSVNVGNLNSTGIRHRDLVILFRHQDIPEKWSSLPGWLNGDPWLWRGEAAVRDESCLAQVNEPLSVSDLRRLRHSVARGRPFGDQAWTRETAAYPGPGVLPPLARPSHEGGVVNALFPPFLLLAHGRTAHQRIPAIDLRQG